MTINKKVLVRFFKFGLVGISGMVVNNAVLWLLHDFFEAALFIASPVAIAVAILNNYTLNGIFTWNKNIHIRKFSYKQGLWRYYFTASISGGLNYITLLLLTHLTGMYYIYANIIGIFIGMIINFTVSEKWVFSQKSKDN
ncbi:MAG: GtrA family protein [Calditrichae bacterium]|nr:GtrA family protein [Calditrichota bacterium]MCB9058172.1 GtrA family protein [Calditrichia bacterium]